MSEQKTGCMPDGYMPIPTAEQLADALENVRCFHDLGAELIAPELLANLLAAPTVKAEPAQCTNEDSWNCKYCRKTETCEALADKRNFGTPAPSLPAAGSAEEEVEVVAWRYRHSEQEKWQAGVERKSLWETEPLMTVAQHARLMAAEIQKRFDGNEQSSREHREELAQLAARDAGEVRVPELSAQEREDLLEFHEAACCDAGHRVEKDGMRRLAEIGAVEPVGFGRHRLTEFGVYLLAQRERGGE